MENKKNKEQKDIRVIYCEGCKDKTKIIHYLGKRLAIYEKALKLACERLSREDVFKNQSIPKFYLQQAKDEIENDNGRIT